MLSEWWVFFVFFYRYCFAVFVRSGLVYSSYTSWRLLVVPFCLYNLVLEPNKMLTDWLYLLVLLPYSSSSLVYFLILLLALVRQVATFYFLEQRWPDCFYLLQPNFVIKHLIKYRSLLLIEYGIFY